jgi:hypothetical protein
VCTGLATAQIKLGVAYQGALAQYDEYREGQLHFGLLKIRDF